MRLWDTATSTQIATAPVSNYITSETLVWDSTANAVVSASSDFLVVVLEPPIANAGQDQTITDSDNNGSHAVTLDGSGSTDSDGTIVSYSWKINGVEIATGVSPQVTLALGVHSIRLTVTDDSGAANSDEVVVTVNAPVQGED